MASENGFEQVCAMDVVRNAGFDKEGRVVFMFLPANLAEGCDLEHVTMYALSVMHDTCLLYTSPSPRD